MAIKITVKHYIDKRLGEEIHGRWYLSRYAEHKLLFSTDEIEYVSFDSPVFVYPVYLQISINHKTTKLRSLTEYKLSEDEFIIYLKNGFYGFEKIGERLLPEVERVHRTLDYFVNVKNIAYKDYDIRTVITFYNRDFSSIYRDAFSMITRNLREKYPKEEIGKIGNFLSPNVNPKKSLDYFKGFGLDMYSYINDYDHDFINIFDTFIIFISYLGDFKDVRLIDWYSGILVDKFKIYLAKNTENDIVEHKISILFAFFEEIESLFEESTRGKGNIERFDKA